VLFDFQWFLKAAGALRDLGKIFLAKNLRLVKTISALRTQYSFTKVHNIQNIVICVIYWAYSGHYIALFHFSTFSDLVYEPGALWDLGYFFSTNNLGVVKNISAQTILELSLTKMENIKISKKIPFPSIIWHFIALNRVFSDFRVLE